MNLQKRRMNSPPKAGPPKAERPGKVGLTGGIGSGKTLVGNIFLKLGIPVFRADEVAKEILEKNKEVKKKVIRYFGNHVLNKNGSVNKKKLAQIVFGNPGALSRLNAILHPVTRKKYRIWVAKFRETAYTVKEAAILFESGADADVDCAIMIFCPQEMRIQRVIERDGVTREAVLKRMEHQWPDDEKMKRCEFVIVNDAKNPVLPQVLKIHEKLMKVMDEKPVNV
ncbi:MAG: dephospho-CoA kinase [Bacteroidetes bacterium]|nr:dephospho-CoA kinase [Bacteroidota bacterium]